MTELMVDRLGELADGSSLLLRKAVQPSMEVRIVGRLGYRLKLHDPCRSSKNEPQRAWGPSFAVLFTLRKPGHSRHGTFLNPLPSPNAHFPDTQTKNISRP